jgi:hypothetical protein
MPRSLQLAQGREALFVLHHAKTINGHARFGIKYVESQVYDVKEQ